MLKQHRKSVYLIKKFYRLQVEEYCCLFLDIKGSLATSVHYLVLSIYIASQHMVLFMLQE